MSEDLRQVFVDESQNIVKSLRKLVSKALQGVSENEINEAYRLIHTLKGAAGFVGLNDLVYVCHKWEETLNLIRKTPRYNEFLPNLASAIEEINEILSATYSEETFVVDASKLVDIEDSLLELIEEISSGEVVDVEGKLRGIYGQVVSLRTRPLNDIFRKIRLGFEELLNKTGKKAIIQTSGGNLTVEIGVLRKLETIIVHLIRNAVDHGIEHPDDRISKGKSEYGLITVDAYQEGTYLNIVVSDDGRGIDFESLKRKAEQMGIEYDNPMELVFRKGFSTLSEATEISGRGYGMDIVLEEARKLGGWVDVETEKDKGTRVSVYVLAALWGTRYLLCKVMDLGIAINLYYVLRVFPLKNLITEGKKVYVEVDKILVPVLWFDESSRFGVLVYRKGRAITMAVSDIDGVGNGTFYPMDFRNENFAGLVVDERGNVFVMPNIIKWFL